MALLKSASRSFALADLAPRLNERSGKLAPAHDFGATGSSAVFGTTFPYCEIPRSCWIRFSIELVQHIASRSVAPDAFNPACICSEEIRSR